MILKIKTSKTLVNGFFFSLFSFFNQGVSFFLLILLANYITPGEYGYLSLFNTIVMFIGYFISLSTQGYISVSFFQKESVYFKKDFSIIFIITLFVFIFLSVILLLFHNHLSHITQLSNSLLWFSLFISTFTLFLNVNLDYLRIKEKILEYGILSCSFAIVNFLLSLYFVIKCSQSWLGRINAQLICSIFFGLISILFFLKNRMFTFRNYTINDFKQIICWGLPLIPHLATNWIRQGCDRYIINYHYSIEEVGLFSFALNLVNIIIILGVAFNSSNSVSIYKILSDNTINNKIALLKKQTNNIFYIYLLSTILITSGGCVLIPIFLPQYSEAIPYFCILSVYAFLQCLYFLYCNYLFYYNKNKKIMLLTFSTSILHLILSYLFTQYSLIVTSFIYIITQAIIVIEIKRFSKKLLMQIK